MAEERKQLYLKNYIGKSSVLLYNKEGTRYIYASYTSRSRYECAKWTIRYGVVQFARKYGSRQEEYEWHWGKRFTQSANGTDIPKWVSTRKDVLEVVDKIGIFEYKK